MATPTTLTHNPIVTDPRPLVSNGGQSLTEGVGPIFNAISSRTTQARQLWAPLVDLCVGNEYRASTNFVQGRDPSHQPLGYVNVFDCRTGYHPRSSFSPDRPDDTAFERVVIGS